MNAMFSRLCRAAILPLLLSGCMTPGTGLYRPDLNDERIGRIARGNDAEIVRTALGEPWRRIRFERTQVTAWDYRYPDSWGYWVDFSVLFGDDGLVQSTASKRVEPTRGH